jgi:hypothetical protein
MCSQNHHEITVAVVIMVAIKVVIKVATPVVMSMAVVKTVALQIVLKSPCSCRYYRLPALNLYNLNM